MVETLDHWMHAIGPFGVAILALAAMLEFIFPPFPGDTILLLGGVYAVRGQQNWVLVVLAITLGSMVGMAVHYALGRRITVRIELDPQGTWFGVRHHTIRLQMERLRRAHVYILLFNRFMPGVRGVIFLAVGAARLPFGRSLLLGAASAIAWNLLVLGVGMAVGGNVERLEQFFHHYTVVAFGIIAVTVAGLFVRWLVVRRRTEE